MTQSEMVNTVHVSSYLRCVYTSKFRVRFRISLHVLLNKNYLFSLLNVQASAKLRVKSRQCKRTFTIHER